jgi:hypothetical protein
LALQVGFVGELTVEVSLESLGFNHESGVVVLGSCVFSGGLVKGFWCSSHFKFLGVSKFGEFVGSFLSLVQIVVNALDSGIIVLALSFLHGNAISKSINFVLVLGFFFSHFGQLILEVVSIFSETVSLISFAASFSCKCHAFLFTSADLVSDCAYFSLVLVVASILLVEEEAEIFDFFSTGHDWHLVLVMSVVIVVILHKFFILEMSVLLLDGIQLVSESNVVFVSLLDLEDLSLQLTDQQVFLVTC